MKRMKTNSEGFFFFFFPLAKEEKRRKIIVAGVLFVLLWLNFLFSFVRLSISCNRILLNFFSIVTMLNRVAKKNVPQTFFVSDQFLIFFFGWEEESKKIMTCAWASLQIAFDQFISQKWSKFPVLQPSYSLIFSSIHVFILILFEIDWFHRTGLANETIFARA